MRMALLFMVVTAAYTALYAAYAPLARTPLGRVVYVVGVVVGTLLGSTLGQRW